MRRNKVLTILVITFFIISMMGCSNNKSKSDNNSSNGKVSLIIAGGEGDTELLTQSIEKFKEEYADEADFDITINEHKEADTKGDILSDVHNAPDVFTFVDDQIATLSASGILEPVYNDEEVRKNNIEGSIDAAIVNDKVYAYPLTADNGYFLYYNKKYLSDQDVTSLDTILNVADNNNKKITMDLSSGWYMYSFFGNTGLEVGINNDGMTNYCTWNANQGEVSGLDVAKYINNMVKRNGFISTDDKGLVSGMKDGSVIAGVSGVWLASDLENILGSDYGAVKLPKYNVNGKEIQMASFSGYKMVGVNSYSKNLDWAAKLAEWISNEDNQVLRFNIKGQGPSNTNVANSNDVEKSLAIRALISQSENAQLQRIGNNYWDPVSDFGKALSTGNISNDELQPLLDNMVKGITASTIKQ